MTINRATERKVIRAAKRQRKVQRTDAEKVLLLSIAYPVDVLNDEGEWEEKEETLDVFVPNLKSITSQEITRIVNTARKLGDAAATDHMLETFLDESTYNFVLNEVDSETFDFINEKLSEYFLGKPVKDEEGKA